MASIKRSIVATLLLLIAHSASAQTLTVQRQASRTTGVAPLAVFFDARGSTASDPTIDPFVDVTYDWTFGDPDSGSWAHSGESKDQASGPVAAHVFETPGTYTVNVVASHGTAAFQANPLTITVADPDVVFSGSKTTCVRATSSGGFSGCPAGANQVTTNDFDAALGSHVAAGRRILFRRGDTFTSSHHYTINNNGPGLIGAFGNGSPPQVRATGDNDILHVGTGFFDWRVMDLDSWGSDGPAGAFLDRSGGTVKSLLLLRIHMRDFSDPITVGAQGRTPGGSNMHDQLAIVDSSSLSRPDKRGNDFFGGGERLMFLGNDFGDAEGDEHTLRFQWLKGAVISHNRIGRNLGAGRHVIKMHDVMNYPICTEEVVVSSNMIEGGPNTRIVDIGPQSNSSTAYDDECIQKVVYERNHHRFRQGVTGTGTLVYFRGGDSVIRNNIFDLTGDYGSMTGVSVNVRLSTQIRRPTHNRIYNNTCYSSKPGTSGGVTCVNLTGSAEDTRVANNLLYVSATGNTRTLLSNSGVRTLTCGGGGSSCNLHSSSNPFVAAQPFATRDFELAAGPAIDGGADVPANPRDFSGVFRPKDGDQNNTQLADIGAFEADGTGAPPPPGSSPGSPASLAPEPPVLLDY